MGSPFKMNPKTPMMKALVGKQKNLPEQLKQAILDAPESPAKSYGKSPMKKTEDKDKIKTEKLKEVVVTAKSPKTIMEQVEKNIAGAHESAGQYKTASGKRKTEIESGKFTTGGRRSDMTAQELRIYHKKKKGAGNASSGQMKATLIKKMYKIK